MKAAVIVEFKKPLQIMEVPLPKIEPDEVLVKVEASGVCHSDVHIANGDWGQLNKIVKKSLILGHESAGYVSAIGSSVRAVKVGDRVGVSWIHWTCEQCEYCMAGRENLCVKQMITGVTVDGGYAQFVKAKASHVAKIPSGISFDHAAPLLCAGLTVYRALKVSGAQPGERVAIFGIGGLGHLGVQIAAVMNMQVVAVDISEQKLAFARSCGATHAIAADHNGTAYRQIQALGGVHAALVTAASRAAYHDAFRSLKRGGTLVVVGMPPEEIAFSPFMMVASETKIVASAVGTRADLVEVFKLASQGKVACRVEKQPLDQINAVFERLNQTQIEGRIVLTMPSAS